MHYSYILLLAILLSSCTPAIQTVRLEMECIIVTGQGYDPDYGSVTWTKIMCPPADIEDAEEIEPQVRPTNGTEL